MSPRNAYYVFYIKFKIQSGSCIAYKADNVHCNDAQCSEIEGLVTPRYPSSVFCLSRFPTVYITIDSVQCRLYTLQCGAVFRAGRSGHPPVWSFH